MEQSLFNGQVKQGTACGTLLIFIANITSGDLLKTMVLAATGAAVSFLVSWGLKALTERKK